MINKHRLTIGYLSRNSSESYELICQSGILTAAKDFNVNVLSFIGGALDYSTGYLNRRNMLYRWISEKNVDGLIISSATVGHIVNKDELRDFLTKTEKGIVLIEYYPRINRYSMRWKPVSARKAKV